MYAFNVRMSTPKSNVFFCIGITKFKTFDIDTEKKFAVRKSTVQVVTYRRGMHRKSIQNYIDSRVIFLYFVDFSL